MKIAFRADASATIGFGHLMRCLVLADAFVQSGFECHFFSKPDDEDNIRQTIEKRGCVMHPVTAELAAIKALLEFSPDWVVFDGYDFDRDYETHWTPARSKALVIDDLANRPHRCDVLVDPTPGRMDEYSTLAPGAMNLVGAPYTLLDRRFSRIREKALEDRKSRGEVTNLLVTLGGGNMVEALGVIAQALAGLSLGSELKIIVLSKQDVRPAYADLQNARFVEHSDDMPTLLSQADICIGAAGGTSWERCCLGLPTVVLQVADNQKDNVRILSTSGAAIHVPIEAGEIAGAVSTLLSSGRLRADMSKKAAAICDGKGVGRVLREVISQSLTVRNAVADDARFIFDARYEGVDLGNYRSGSVPSYKQHVAWFSRELDNPLRNFLILELAGKAVAHVRLDTLDDNAGKAEIGIAISENARGKGFGASILETACQHYFESGGREILAEVKHENMASKKIFDATGFRLRDDGADGFFKLAIRRADLDAQRP